MSKIGKFFKNIHNPQNEDNEFDTNLPTEHSYLGQMNNLHGYTLFDDGSEIEMLGLHTDTLVCPGYTLPLMLDFTSEIDIMKQYMNDTKTFVLVCTRANETVFDYGITMEVIEVSESDNSMALKAKGRQRCRILKQTITLTLRMGKVTVKILPEIELSSPLRNIQLPSLEHSRVHLKDYQSLRMNDKYRMYDSAQTVWPCWLYDRYELHVLSRKIINILNAYSLGQCVPSDPVKLSYWFIQNFQLNHNERLEILKLDSANQRLSLELHYLQMKRLLCCGICSRVVAKQSDVFAMSKDGVQSNYCNPGGHVYETLTVSEAYRITLVGRPSEEFSWFPGYAWTVAQCAYCDHHLGWLFTSKKLSPRKFWGLAKNCIVAKIIPNSNL